MIVVDDGSTDRTCEVLDSYGGAIRVVRQSNRGPAAAANAGVRQALGKYVAFCDHDDLWLANHLQLLTDYFSAHPSAGLVFSNAGFFDQDKTRIQRTMMREKYTRLLHRRSLAPKDFFMKPILTTLSVVMVAKSVFDAVGGFNERVRFMNDRDLALRVSLNHDVGYLDQVSCLHRIHGDSLSAKVQAVEPGYLQVIEELDRADPNLRIKVGKFQFRSRLFSAYRRVAEYYVSLGDRVAAREAYHQARRWAWWRPSAYRRVPRKWTQ